MGRRVEACREATCGRARADVAAWTTGHRCAPGTVARRIDRLDTGIRGRTRKIEGSSHDFDGTRPSTVAHSDVQGHHSATDAEGARTAVAEKAATS